MISEKLSLLSYFSLTLSLPPGFFSLCLPLPNAPFNPNCASSTAIAPPRQLWQERAWSVRLPWNPQFSFPNTSHTILWNPHHALKSSKSNRWCQSTACCLSLLKFDCFGYGWLIWIFGFQMNGSWMAVYRLGGWCQNGFWYEHVFYCVNTKYVSLWLMSKWLLIWACVLLCKF